MAALPSPGRVRARAEGATVTAGITLDEAYERLQMTGPEFDGWLSNHGPMAADAMLRLGHGPELDRWLRHYTGRLEAAPATRWAISPSDWQEYLGDPSRLGDWTDLFAVRLQEEPWREVLTTWLPRLLPGSIAASTHGLIRTGHAVRALLEEETGPRRAELAEALGYWAARWQPLPATVPVPDDVRPREVEVHALSWAQRLRSVPVLDMTGGARSRLRQLEAHRDWAAFRRVDRLPKLAVDQIPTSIDDLVDAAVGGYADWAPGHPVMLVHAATAPRAAGLLLPALPPRLWHATLQWSWRTSATIVALYRSSRPVVAGGGQVDRGRGRADEEPPDRAVLAARAVGHGDEHVIKFTEVALESHVRGQAFAGSAIRVALAAIPPA